jgi:hypothetical protein
VEIVVIVSPLVLLLAVPFEVVLQISSAALPLTPLLCGREMLSTRGMYQLERRAYDNPWVMLKKVTSVFRWGKSAFSIAP